MISLVVLWESFTNGYRAEVLDVLSLLSIFCGILIIVSKNPIVLWDKLSNSGEVLKFMIPSFNRKVKCGWINYSCMVTRNKILYRVMDDRGSKSVI